MMNQPIAAPSSTLVNRDSGWRDRWFPEGFLVPLLLLAYVAVASFSVQYADWPGIVIPIGAIGIGACAFGVLVAKAPISESLAHMGSFLAGIVTVFGMVLLVDSGLGEGWRHRIRPMGSMLLDWYLGRNPTTEYRDLLVSMLMGFIVWLSGYLAAWTLYRRGWLMASLFLPGLFMLVNLGYAPRPYPWMLAIMVAIVIPMGARFHLYQRQQEWNRTGLKSPLALGMRVTVIATICGLLITTASWNAPESWSQASFQPLINAISDQVQMVRDRAESWMDQNGGPVRDLENAGSYTAFDDAFSVGGPLHLSDQEEVLVRADLADAPYLTAHRYDVYTGRGWASGADDEFERSGPDGKQYSPELLFRPGQSVVLSGEVTGARAETTIQVTPLVESPGVLFTVDTYQKASVPAVVRMSWRQLDDEPYPLSISTLTSLPPDIQMISSLLLRSDLSGTSATASDPAMQAQIDDEVSSLHRRMIDVRWETDGAGQVTVLYVTGQLPVYDDVEAVFPRNPDDTSAGGSYSVTGLSSVATADELASAGTEYPSWVNDRYLQLGDTVTPRTIDLALQIAGDAGTPYEQAMLIRDWLRTNIVYDENVAAPPSGEDVVDYVLFENQRGYCEHYSSAMTVMMRALGVPARTVVGYYPGELDNTLGGYLYRQRNAHAWTEVFFPGYGWIPFEPTANRPLGEFDRTAESGIETPAPTEEVEAGTPEPQPTQDVATPAVEHPPLENPGPPAMIPEEESGRPNWIVPAAIGLTSLAVAGGGLWLAWNWKLRGLSTSASLYRRLERAGRIGGVESTPSTTPREYAASFERSVPSVGPAARRIVQVYETDQFGPDGADEGRLASAREAWRQVRSLIPTILLRRRR
ncbi:MAG TPA: transglutaminase domain-containing protein [Thermomicrobiales bacterium]|nr:transglutaminase domain-containing protein [Thermomicrobiales bacterium]